MSTLVIIRGLTFSDSTWSKVALSVHLLQQTIAGLILWMWREDGVKRVCVRSEAVIVDGETKEAFRVDPAGPHHRGVTWPIDDGAVRPLLVASIALGIEYDGAPRFIEPGRAFEVGAREWRAQIEAVDDARREVP